VALKIHRSDHPDLLVDALCDVIATPRTDPLATEIIAVPTRGIDRWLTERIGTVFAERGIGDGIAANIDFPFVHRVASDTLSHIPGTAGSLDARTGGALVAHLDRILDDHHSEPRLAIVARFIEGPDRETTGVQRLRAARKIAGLFSSYERHRPGMIAAWSRGDDVGPTGEPIDPSAAWQPYVWRLLNDDVGVPSVSETLPASLAAIRAGTARLDLPERLSVYGATALDPGDLAVLDAIATHRDVHLFLLHQFPVSQNDICTINNADSAFPGHRLEVFRLRNIQPSLFRFSKASLPIKSPLSNATVHPIPSSSGVEPS